MNQIILLYILGDFDPCFLYNKEKYNYLFKSVDACSHNLNLGYMVDVWPNEKIPYRPCQPQIHIKGTYSITLSFDKIDTNSFSKTLI